MTLYVGGMTSLKTVTSPRCHKCIFTEDQRSEKHLSFASFSVSLIKRLFLFIVSYVFLIYKESSNICEDNIHMLPNAKTKEERFIFTDFNPEIHFVCFWDEFKVPESIETFCMDVKQHESKK